MLRLTSLAHATMDESVVDPDLVEMNKDIGRI
jgi:hypothetical protein